MIIAKLSMDKPLFTLADYEAYVETLLPEEPTPELMNGGIVFGCTSHHPTCTFHA